MLRAEGIWAGYGGTRVLQGVSMEVEEGEIVAVLGSNGAGKTTLLNVLSGLLKPDRGVVYLQGQSITGLPAHKMVRLGVAHVPEGRRLFGKLTVHDNLLLGAYGVRDEALLRATLGFVYQLFPILRERRNQRSETLSGGQQQMLAIARGLMSSPKILLLDEPSLGLMPVFVKATFEALKELRRRGLTVLLVEQNVRRALEVADRGYILQNGKVVLTDTSAELIEHPLVRKAYLAV